MSTTLPEDLEERAFDIQASDTTDLQTAVQNVVAKKRDRRQRKSDLDIEATVRELIDAIQNVLAISPAAATKLLDELHYTLRLDEDIDRITDPRDDLLQREGGAELDDTGAKKTRALWRRHRRLPTRRSRWKPSTNRGTSPTTNSGRSADVGSRKARP